jgi:hypothetical protein
VTSRAHVRQATDATMRPPGLLERLTPGRQLRRCLVASAAVALQACTSMDQLRSVAPQLKLHSDRSPQEIAFCVYQAWTQAGIVLTPDVSIHPLPHGMSVLVRSDKLGARILADVTDNPSGGSDTVYYEGVMPFASRFAVPVATCQHTS